MEEAERGGKEGETQTKAGEQQKENGEWIVCGRASGKEACEYREQANITQRHRADSAAQAARMQTPWQMTPWQVLS